MNINENISMQDCTDYQLFSIHELNEAISRINVSKSYKRHQHWKNLISPNHVAKQCLINVLNNWLRNILTEEESYNIDEWDMFITNLNPTPKKDKKDLSNIKSWRPISIGTSGKDTFATA